ncbi:MAG: hypothetical protein EDX89_23845 [Acidobacteria bacterium]|nr:MAG: hypothetical protein EDX89_23845 [Acidobacteriota bacterium]
MTARTRLLLLACFFVSGGTGLVYEVLWSRHLSLLFGSTTEAVSVVLAVFMTGLGAGAYFLGPRVDRSPSPMRLYALFEAGVGAYALLTGPLLSLVRAAWLGIASRAELSAAAATGVKGLLAALVLLPPAFLMGGTLPALVRAVSEDVAAARRRVALLYALNTLGAVAGTLAEGFVFLEAFGLWRTMWLTALVNLLIGWVVFRRSVQAEAAAPPDEAREPLLAALRRLATAPGGRYALLGLVASGAATMAYEIVFLRVLGIVFGVSAQAFTIVLACFLLGLGLGSLAAARLSRVRAARLSDFALSQLLVAIAALAAHAVLPRATRAIVLLHQWPEPTFGQVLLGKALVAAAFLLPLAFLAGLGVPLLLEALADEVPRLGRIVGAAYLANTAGTVLGSLLAGFVLVPRLGTEGTLEAALGLSAAVAAAGLLRPPRTGRSLALAGASAAALLAALLAPSWPVRLFLFSDTAIPQGPVATRLEMERRATAYPYEALAFREGRNAAVAVGTTQMGRVLLVSGHPDGSDQRDMETQLLLAVVPLAVHPRPGNVLVVGFGTGVTAGAVARAPGVDRVTTVEIERAVLDVAPFFSHVNGEVLSSPKLRVVVDDARSHVLSTRQKYDLVVSEPSNPWRAGVASLFTREFFEGVKGTLAPGGVLAQWVQLYFLEPESLRMILRTLGDVFPEVEVWMLDGLNVVVLASERPLTVDRARLEAVAGGTFRDELRKHAWVDSPDALLARRLLGTKEARAFAGDGERHTDDLPLLEFAAGRGFYRADGRNAARLLAAKLASGALAGPVSGTPPEEGRLWLEVAAMCRASGLKAESGQALDRAEKAGEAARALARRAAYANADREPASTAAALAAFERLPGPVPADAAREAALTRARLLVQKGELEAALSSFGEAAPLTGAEQAEKLGALVLSGRPTEAIGLARDLLTRARVGGDVAGAEVGVVLDQLLDLAARGASPLELARLLEETSAGSTGLAVALRLKTRAFLLDRAGRPSEALAAVERAIEVGPVDPQALALRVRLLSGLGREDEAIEAGRDLEEVVPRALSEPVPPLFPGAK